MSTWFKNKFPVTHAAWERYVATYRMLVALRHLRASYELFLAMGEVNLALQVMEVVANTDPKHKET